MNKDLLLKRVMERYEYLKNEHVCIIDIYDANQGMMYKTNHKCKLTDILRIENENADYIISFPNPADEQEYFCYLEYEYVLFSDVEEDED